MIIEAGKTVAMGFGLLIFIITVYYYYFKGEIPTPRFAAVDAISEGVDRAVEMGKPVHYTGGDRCDMKGTMTPMTIASFSGLAYTAALCVEKGARLIVSGPRTAEVIPILQKIVYDQYSLRGMADKYDVSDIRYYGGSFSAGVLDTFSTDGVACNIVIGASSGDALVILSTARRHRALNIGGTARWIMQYAFATLADYMLIAEEIYTAAAVMTKDPEMIATIRGGDLVKTIALILLIVGGILSVTGLNTIQALLRV